MLEQGAEHFREGNVCELWAEESIRAGIVLDVAAVDRAAGVDSVGVGAGIPSGVFLGG